MVKRHEVVDRRRTHARALRRIHPIREVKDVELAEQSLRGRVTEPTPCRAHRVGEGQRPRAHLHIDPAERSANPARAFDARRRERDDLVLARGGFRDARERAPHVVPDPEERMAQRTDVERDPHRRGL